jgi:transposase
MSRKPRRKYTKQFKADAVRLVREGSGSQSDVARHLGIGPSLLSAWVLRAESKEEVKGTLDPKEQAEVERLRREVEQLRMERDFLKKAAAFFAKNQS